MQQNLGDNLPEWCSNFLSSCHHHRKYQLSAQAQKCYFFSNVPITLQYTIKILFQLSFFFVNVTVTGGYSWCPYISLGPITMILKFTLSVHTPDQSVCYTWLPMLIQTVSGTFIRNPMLKKDSWGRLVHNTNACVAYNICHVFCIPGSLRRMQYKWLTNSSYRMNRMAAVPPLVLVGDSL